MWNNEDAIFCYILSVGAYFWSRSGEKRFIFLKYFYEKWENIVTRLMLWLLLMLFTIILELFFRNYFLRYTSRLVSEYFIVNNF